MKAMIFAAGLGTRLAPLTNTMPKAMVPINGKPMIQHQIEKLYSSGFDYIVVNVHHFAEQLVDFLANNNFGPHIEISDESDKLLDTGGGLKNVKHFFDEGDNFLIHNVDIFSDLNLKDLYDFHCKSNNVATLAVSHRDSSKHLLFDTQKRLCGWRDLKSGKSIISQERSEYDEMAFSGIYVCNYRIFDLIENEGVFPIIPELLKISKNSLIGGFVHDGGKVLDVGKIDVIRRLESGE
ncbi:MAG: nucleotidyltransferase family protein [Bacteroidales bacterium]|nr:nucleotidyltransferase family protein [Bacteroidales bacterium]